MSKQRTSRLFVGLVLCALLLAACGATVTPAPITVSPKVVEVVTPTPPGYGIDDQVWTFPDEGVEITIPPQAETVHVVQLPLPLLKDYAAPVPGGFDPFRPVINFDVLYDDDQPVQHFDPPIQIKVRYTGNDVMTAGVGGLKLGFWDGLAWWPYTDAKHDFQLVPDADKSGGVGIVTVSDWGDPTQIWGR